MGVGPFRNARTILFRRAVIPKHGVAAPQQTAHNMAQHTRIRGSLEHAIAIASEAHAGVTDKAGAPYILHPLRVMLAVEGDVARTTAVLHDVIEDCPEWTFDRLAGEGFGADVIDALRSVTKLPEETEQPEDSVEQRRLRYLAFVGRAAAHPIGRMVKLADLEDNLNVTRLAAVSQKDAARLSKYLEARALLLAL